MKKIQSVERAMLLLSLMDSVGGNEGIGVGELAVLSGLKTPTAHNLLQTLLQLGYVEQGDRCRYRISEKTKWLGWDGTRKNRLIQLVQPHLMRLAYETNETVLLAARSGKKWQTLMKIESARILTARSILPVTDNFYISATGRCILSGLSTDNLGKYVRDFRLPLEKEWPGTGSMEKLKIRLEKIRKNGYEIYVTPDGITGVGAVIRHISDAAEGALGVIIPTFRFRGINGETVLEKILHAARCIRREEEY